jgi:hypothetical protein
MGGKAESLLLAGLATGVVASLVEVIPGVAGCLTCAVYIGSGMLAVWHYANTYAVTLTAGSGAGLGAGAGILAGIVSALIDYAIAALGGRPTFREQMEAGFRALEEGGMGPDQLDQIRTWMDTPSVIVAAIAFGLLMIAVMGAIGGAIGAGAFRRGESPVE